MLNTKLSDQVVLDLPLSESLLICRKVVVDLGWRVMEQTDNSIRCKEVAPHVVSFTWPAEVDIVLSSTSQSQTAIDMHAKIFGFGPVQKGHLQGQLGNLRNRIELSIQQATKASHPIIGVSLAAELGKLAALHQQGILTIDEFDRAKQRLLEKNG